MPIVTFGWWWFWQVSFWLFSWPHQLLNFTAGCSSIVFNNAPRHKLLHRWIQTNAGSFDRIILVVRVWDLFWPQEASSQLSYSSEVFRKLESLQCSLHLQWIYRSLPSYGKRSGVLCFTTCFSSPALPHYLPNLWAMTLKLGIGTMACFSLNYIFTLGTECFVDERSVGSDFLACLSKCRISIL